MQNRQKGFTLIELMIAIAILGILSAIAIPSYGNYVREARRTDGHIALQAAAQELERCRSQTFTYDGCAITAGSPDGHYTVAAQGTSTATAFLLQATPVPGGAQANDTACNAMTINALGTTEPSGPTATDATAIDCW